MVMDAAKTHNSTPPPGGGWVDSGENTGGKVKRGEGGGSCRSRNRRRTTTNTDLVPPDGGWGWMIVFASCINTGVLNSITACFGMLYQPLVALGYTNAQVASVPSIFVSCTNLLAPLSTGLSHYYTARRLTAIGMVIAVLGILLCSFCKNIIWIYICLGVLTGMGNALANPQGFLLGQKYFCHKRVTASGLSTVGASMGIMVLPILVNYLVEIYALEGAFLVWSGILLHGLVGASLYHPVEWHLRPKRTASLDAISVQQNSNQKTNDIPNSKIVVAVKGEDHRGCGMFEDENIAKSLTPDKDESDESDQEELIITQDVLLDTYDQKKNISDNHYSERQWKNPLTDVLQTNEFFERPLTVSTERSMEILPQIPEESEDEDCFETYDPESGNEHVEFLNHENEMRNRPISYISTKSVDSIAKIPSAESIFNSCDMLDQFGSALSFKVERLKDSSRAAELERRKQGRSSSANQQPLRPYIFCGLKVPKLQHLINFSILRHPIFIIAASSTIVNRQVYVCLLTYLPSFGNEVGIGWKAPYLLTIIAIFELLGKVIMSVITDQGWIQRRYFYMLATTTCAIAILCMTLATNTTTLGVCCGFYGFCVGTVIAIDPVLLVEYLGLKLLPHSFGLQLFFNGITSLALFPFTGWLRDVAGDFIISFYVLGSLTLLPSILWSLVPCFPKATSDASKIPTDNV